MSPLPYTWFVLFSSVNNIVTPSLSPLFICLSAVLSLTNSWPASPHVLLHFIYINPSLCIAVCLQLPLLTLSPHYKFFQCVVLTTSHCPPSVLLQSWKVLMMGNLIERRRLRESQDWALREQRVSTGHEETERDRHKD